jgi:hypothetical protein
MIESALAGACDVGSDPCDGALTERASADGAGSSFQRS